MRIPTILSSVDARAPNGGAQPAQQFLGPGAPAQISFGVADAIASGGQAIASGLSSIAGAANRLDQQNKQDLKQRQQYDNHLWSESQFTTAQRDWIQWTNDVQKNGSEDVVGQFKERFAKYQEGILKTAPNEDAATRLKLRMDDMGSRLFESALKIEATNRAQNTINTFDKMLTETTDMVAQNPESYAVPTIQLLQNIDDAREQGRITEQVAIKLREQANNIQVVAAEALVAKNPDYAKDIIDNAQGIDWAKRKAVLGEIERAKVTNDTLFKYNQTEAFQSTIASVAATGQGVKSFDVETYAQAFPAEHRPAVIAEANAKIELAKQLYVGKSELQGKPPGQINQVLEKYTPQAGDPKFADKQQVLEVLQRAADQQVKMFQKDPFAYSRQDPVVDKAWKMVEDLPKDAKPELVNHLTQQALEASLNYQRQSGVAEGRLSVMSGDAASQYAQRINNGDTKQIQDALGNLQQVYGRYYPEAFRDLVRLPEGQRIDAAAQVVALHQGQPFMKARSPSPGVPNLLTYWPTRACALRVR